MTSERKSCAVAFLTAAVAYYASLGVTVERVTTDNSPCYQSAAFRNACKRLGIRHFRTRPYTPKTNGTATIGTEPHGSIGSVPPISRPGLTEDNLLRLHI
jgi:hypothetical protein